MVIIKWIKNFFWGLYKFLTHRGFLTALLLLFQFVVLYFVFSYLSYYRIYYQIVFEIIAILVIIYIMNQDLDPTMKISFIAAIALLPFFGIPFYFVWQGKTFHKRYIEGLEKSKESTKHLHIQNDEVIKELEEKDLKRYHETQYVYDESYMPVHRNTNVKYYSSGEELYPHFIEILKNAKHFIFLEFFIINKGSMWDEILEILKEKVRQGVEVRLMYDDFGCAGYLPMNYYRELNKYGIKCIVFNPFNPRLTANHNFRDHRKICVVDGYLGVSGGFNLSDEYINRVSLYGYWKDSAICLTGEAVWNLTVFFLENWDFASKTKTNYSVYTPYIYHKEHFAGYNDGFVMPYADNPLDDEHLSETVILNIISNAEKYVWFTTPYLILDNTLQNALETAAKRGIDVRIITPGIPDNKRQTYVMTRSYYKHLIKNKVKVYEYKPGFVHAKNCISDDEVMTCGTVNLDYRSLYHHFENGVWVYDSSSIKDMKKDFEQMFEHCEEISLDWIKKRPWWTRFRQYIYRILAPFL